MADPRSIDGETMVDDLLAAYPASASAFIRRRMNCVGCEVARFETVADACRNYGVPLNVLLAELREAAASG